MDRRDEAAPPEQSQPLTAGETRQRIAPAGSAGAIVRSGPLVPVRLPPGFTLYPGATVVSNAVVESGGERRILLAFDSPDPIEKIISYYRAQALAAGAVLTLDLGGTDRASIGGTLAGSGTLAVAARRNGSGTRVEFAAN